MHFTPWSAVLAAPSVLAISRGSRSEDSSARTLPEHDRHRLLDVCLLRLQRSEVCTRAGDRLEDARALLEERVISEPGRQSSGGCQAHTNVSACHALVVGCRHRGGPLGQRRDDLGEREQALENDEQQLLPCRCRRSEAPPRRSRGRLVELGAGNSMQRSLPQSAPPRRSATAITAADQRERGSRAARADTRGAAAAPRMSGLCAARRARTRRGGAKSGQGTQRRAKDERADQRERGTSENARAGGR